MPPRQPPRPAPRPSKAPSRGGAKGGAARGGAKGTAAKGGAKGGAKTGGVRKAAPAKAAPRGGRQPAGRGATAEQLRQQRLMLDQQRRQREARWWAINQHAMKDLHSRQHHAAGGEAIGTILNADRRMRWRTSRAIGAITLLILAFFFTSMAIGAQSMRIAMLAFLCLAGCIAFFTVEHSARRFPQPVPAPPVIGQHRLEDLIVEDDPPRPPAAKAPGTIDALDDLFEPASPPAGAKPAPAAAAPVKPAPEPAAAATEPKPVGTPAPKPTAAAEGAAPPAATEPAQSLTEPEPPAGPSAGGEPPPRPDPPAPAVFTLPSEQVGGAEVAVASRLEDQASPKGPIAEAVTKLKAPAPPRQRAPSEGHGITRELAELLLSEERLGSTDVTDVAATLIVADLQRSVEFYTDALGLQVADRTDEAAVLDAGFGKILLWERPDAPPGETGVMHLTFEVGDIDATFAEMNEAGVQFLHLPRTALLGKNYQMRAAAFRDPDGHGLAITEHRERE
jgi:catechol 2,3-dioxygenase-like lactoylglutathione lyase family enzyme